jgi:hypothetical protein
MICAESRGLLGDDSEMNLITLYVRYHKQVHLQSSR